MITRRQQDVVEAAALGPGDDVAAMFVARAQAAVGDAEEFVIVVAQRRKPAYFDGWKLRAHDIAPRRSRIFGLTGK